MIAAHIPHGLLPSPTLQLHCIGLALLWCFGGRDKRQRHCGDSWEALFADFSCFVCGIFVLAKALDGVFSVYISLCGHGRHNLVLCSFFLCDLVGACTTCAHLLCLADGLLYYISYCHVQQSNLLSNITSLNLQPPRPSAHTVWRSCCASASRPALTCGERELQWTRSRTCRCQKCDRQRLTFGRPSPT